MAARRSLAGSLAGLLLIALLAPVAHAGPSFSVTDMLGAGDFLEGDSGTRNMAFKVKLKPASSKTTKIDFKAIDGGPSGSVFDGPAKVGKDYVATSGTLTFKPGETVKKVQVPIIGDKANEVSFEQLYLKLSNPLRAGLGNSKGGGVILNDDDLPTFQYSEESVNEGSSAPGSSLQVDVTLSEASGRQVKLDWFVEDDYQLSAPDGMDYTGGSGTLIWSPGQKTTTFNIPITPDLIDEDDQQVDIGFGAQVNAAMEIDHEHAVTIIDDDAEPTLSVTPASAPEGSTNQFEVLEIPLTWSHPTERQVSGSWSITHVTTDESDLFGGGSLSYAPSLSALVYGDSQFELSETFTVSLDGTPSGFSYNPQASIATVTLTNDD